MQSLLQQLSQIPKSHHEHAEARAIGDDLSFIELKLKTSPDSMHLGVTYTFYMGLHPPSFLDSSIKPRLRSGTPIFHPNIDQEYVCCNLLGEHWQAGTTLEAIIASLFCLLENPAFDNAIEDGWWSIPGGPLASATEDGYNPENYQDDLEKFIKENKLLEK